MPDEHTCHSPAELAQLVNQVLPVEDIEALARHLEQCERCAETVDQLLSRNMLVEAARSPPVIDTLPTALPGLLERIRRMSQSAAAEMDASSSGTGLDIVDLLAPPQEPDEAGRLGGYRVLRVLGSGGMGIVFQAEDLRLRRPVALKVMRPALAAVALNVQRFLREARSAAAIEHDHIVTIYQVGEDRGVAFLAMQYLLGESLDARLKREPRLPLKEALRIGRETALGLAAVHKRGLIHRDIKPANLWLEAETSRVKILDFGLARTIADDAHLTASGALLGTPAYMAPEQVVDQRVDHRCDLFSLGCVLYRMLTGVTAFEGKNTLAILCAELEASKPPHEVNPEIPAALSSLILRLLARRPQDRPVSAQIVADELWAMEQHELCVELSAESAQVVRPNKLVERAPGREGIAANVLQPRRAPALLAGVLLACATVWSAVWFGTLPTGPPKDAALPTAPPLSRALPSPPRPDEPFTLWPLIAELGPHPAQINSLAISSDSKLLAVGCGTYWEPEAQGKVWLWDLATRQDAGVLQDHITCVTCVAFAPANYKGILAAGTGNLTKPHLGDVRLWNVDDKRGQLEAFIIGFKQGVSAVAFSPDGTLLATAGAHGDRALAVWSVPKLLEKTGDGPARWRQDIPAISARERLFTEFTGPLMSVVFSRDGKWMAVASGGGIKLWDTIDWTEPTWLSPDSPCGQVQSVAFSADGLCIAAVTSLIGAVVPVSAPEVLVWNLASPRGEPRRFVHLANFACVAFSPDGRFLITGDQDGGVFVWNAETGVGRPLPYTHRGWVWGLAVSHDGRKLVTGATDPMAKVWRIAEE